jgi:hypothetical protein
MLQPVSASLFIMIQTDLALFLRIFRSGVTGCNDYQEARKADFAGFPLMEEHQQSAKKKGGSNEKTY